MGVLEYKGGEYMFKKLINDERSEEWNIVMYSLILAALFFIVFTPIIIYGLSIYPELSETLTAVADTSNEKLQDAIYSTRSVIEFFIYGTILEFFRRKKSMKFKITDGKATKLLFYFFVEMFVFDILTVLGGLLLLSV